MNWMLLICAGIFEICWAVGLKSSHGFTRPVPSLLTVAAMAVSLLLLSFSMRTLPPMRYGPGSERPEPSRPE